MLQTDVPGRTFLLQANRIGSLNLGSPIMYRDLEVGEVLGWDVGEMARNITIHAFVREPFDKYVRDNSRFWNASGATVHLGANGLQLQVESLRAIVLGGIAFKTPEDPKITEESQPITNFTLFNHEDAANSSSLQAHHSVCRQFYWIGIRSVGRGACYAARPEGRRGHQRLAGL